MFLTVHIKMLGRGKEKKRKKNGFFESYMKKYFEKGMGYNYYIQVRLHGAFRVAQTVKNLPAMRET